MTRDSERIGNGPISSGVFSLIEVMVASALLLIMATGLLALAHPAVAGDGAQASMVDLQQRARAAAQVLRRDLAIAGAGLDSGDAAGPLGQFIPALLPRRLGGAGADPFDQARGDAITVLWVPDALHQTTAAQPSSSSVIALVDGSGCAVAAAACGFEPGMGMVVFDLLGRFDLYTVVLASGASADVRLRTGESAGPFPPGAFVAPIVARTYYLDISSRQLRLSDDDQTDTPVIDDVVSMVVEYFGTAAPPMRPKPPDGVANCLYDAAGTRLPADTFSDLPVDDGLVAIPLDRFSDGPWCGAGSTRFDADLLRVRRVRITLRLQAADDAVRGAGSLFATPGTSRSAWRRVPDAIVTLDLAPRNLRGPSSS
jgi:hypothetical protein